MALTVSKMKEMPITKIEVNEYECARCGHKWINRVNGKDGQIPKYCAKCKRTSWKGEMSPKENGLRRRIQGYNELYSHRYEDKMRNMIKWNPDVVEKFLIMEPRATIKQLEKIVYSSPLFRYNNGADIYRTRSYVPDPDKPGYLKYDRSPWIPDPDEPKKRIYNPDPNFVSDHKKAIIQEAQIRRKLMENILKERGIEIESVDVRLGKILLELGRKLEEAGTTPRHKICARLIKELSDTTIDKSDIERLCPTEWKQKQPANRKKVPVPSITK